MTASVLQSEHPLRIAVANLLLVSEREGKSLHDLDGLAHVERALLRIERAVGCEQHVIRPEELDAADGSGAPAGKRGVAIKVLEVVERPFLQPLEQGAVVLVRGACA